MKLRYLWALVGLATLLGCTSPEPARPGPAVRPADRYYRAIADAAFAEPGEIVDDLIAIRPDEEGLKWREIDGTPHVLVLTWTDWPGYEKAEDETMDLAVNVWVTVVPEVADRLAEEKVVGDAAGTMRCRELLGLPPDARKRWFVSLWVRPTDLFRPAPDPEVDDRTCIIDRPQKGEGPLEDHPRWYADLMAGSYLPEGGYPWTRLGYTYDWGSNGSEVGVSEFVLRRGASVVIDDVTTTEAFLSRLPDSKKGTASR